MNLFEFLFTVSLVFFVSGFITWVRHMVYTIASETKEQENEKNNLTSLNNVL